MTDKSESGDARPRGEEQQSQAERMVGEMHDDHLISVCATMLRSNNSTALADELERRFGGSA